MWLRGLIIWLGAAVIGTGVGTVGSQLVLSGGWRPQDLRFLLVFAAMGLIFTTGGSALLALVYSSLERRNLPAGWLVLAGGVAGMLVLCPFGGEMALGGGGYGVATALAWLMLLKLTKADRMG